MGRPIPFPKKTQSSYQSHTSGTCQGMTKKGRQCSRTVRSGSYCWQHGG